MNKLAIGLALTAISVTACHGNPRAVDVKMTPIIFSNPCSDFTTYKGHVYLMNTWGTSQVKLDDLTKVSVTTKRTSEILQGFESGDNILTISETLKINGRQIRDESGKPVSSLDYCGSDSIYVLARDEGKILRYGEDRRSIIPNVPTESYPAPLPLVPRFSVALVNGTLCGVSAIIKDRSNPRAGIICIKSLGDSDWVIGDISGELIATHVDSQHIVAVFDNKWLVIDMPTGGRTVHTMPIDANLGHISDNGRFIVASDFQGNVVVIDTRVGGVICRGSIPDMDTICSWAVLDDATVYCVMERSGERQLMRMKCTT